MSEGSMSEDKNLTASLLGVYSITSQEDPYLQILTKIIIK